MSHILWNKWAIGYVILVILLLIVAISLYATGNGNFILLFISIGLGIFGIILNRVTSLLPLYWNILSDDEWEQQKTQDKTTKNINKERKRLTKLAETQDIQSQFRIIK